MKSDSTSPIKDPPLRLPGQSLMEERARIWDDKVEPWALMAVFMIALAALEWVRFYRNDRFNPWLFSAVAAVAWRLPLGNYVARGPGCDNCGWPSRVRRPSGSSWTGCASAATASSTTQPTLASAKPTVAVQSDALLRGAALTGRT